MPFFLTGTQQIFLALLTVVNLVAFCLMALDKHRARRRAAGAAVRRIPEKTLFAAALLFGAPGGTLGMFCFRHKTRHWYFCIGFPLLAVLQAVALYWLWLRLGVALY